MNALGRAPKTGWCVVLADDDDDYSMIIELALRQAAGVPVEIRRARTGEEAIALLKDFIPDLLLLDLNMPGMAGHEALEAIKSDERLRSVPVAILSSSDRDDDVARSYLLGGNHYITKPGTPRELEEKLAMLLRNVVELGGIRRGFAGTSPTAVSAVNPGSILELKMFRWAAVLGVLIALYFFGKTSGVF
jgi:CheY-like chemotaxis protein